MIAHQFTMAHQTWGNISLHNLQKDHVIEYNTDQFTPIYVKVKLSEISQICDWMKWCGRSLDQLLYSSYVIFSQIS